MKHLRSISCRCAHNQSTSLVAQNFADTALSDRQSGVLDFLHEAPLGDRLHRHRAVSIETPSDLSGLLFGRLAWGNQGRRLGESFIPAPSLLRSRIATAALALVIMEFSSMTLPSFGTAAVS